MTGEPRVQMMPPKDIEVRCDALLDLLARSLDDSPIARHRSFHLAHLDGRLRHATSYRKQFLVAAEGADDQPIGFAYGQAGTATTRLPGLVEAANPRFANDALLVLWVAVDPAHRRRGLATRLLATLLDTSTCQRAWLRVHQDNHPAQRLYRQQGWSLLGPDDDDRIYGVALGPWPGR